jgi:hypothetical protein
MDVTVRQIPTGTKIATMMMPIDMPVASSTIPESLQQTLPMFDPGMHEIPSQAQFALLMQLVHEEYEQEEPGDGPPVQVLPMFDPEMQEIPSQKQVEWLRQLAHVVYGQDPPELGQLAVPQIQLLDVNGKFGPELVPG